jgi:hypothetical protein
MSKRKGRSEELDNRIRYLWAKVRVAVKQPGLLWDLEE